MILTLVLKVTILKTKAILLKTKVTVLQMKILNLPRGRIKVKILNSRNLVLTAVLLMQTHY